MAAHGAFRLLRVSASVTNTHLVARAFPSALSGRCLCSAAARGHVGFSDPEVQRLLKVMTGCDLQKVFKVTPQPTLKPPSYKLLTDQQLQQAVSAAEEEAGHLLTPPPELEERVAINDELSHDALLEGADEAKLVFTDITLNVPHRERFMVVREPSGSLRKASWEERDRILQIYFPKEGRQLTHPAIFNQESMKLALSEWRHEVFVCVCNYMSVIPVLSSSWRCLSGGMRYLCVCNHSGFTYSVESRPQTRACSSPWERCRDSRAHKAGANN
ncbi:28S ribosomal protein S22, mitochondrial isoform X2 [Engraulis encrasicolus]|uniref:28S ribosomal protein S22, mitochondrial isoform X2 n=1 Tax=Engraulis encrasicolus TaxID=184585 RepID=UPI002FD5B92F